MIKTFRGLLADGGQEHIRLSTIKGKVGYKIVKFQLFPEAPGTNDYEAVAQVFMTEQSSVPTTGGTVDFTDSDLLAAAYYIDGSDYYRSASLDVIFDNTIFNQDVFVTHTANQSTSAINYYLELEVIPLDDKAAEYTTIKDLRTRGF